MILGTIYILLAGQELDQYQKRHSTSAKKKGIK